MSLRSYEASILAALRDQTGKRSLRQKDIMEWSTGEIASRDGETVVHVVDRLRGVDVWVAFLTRPVK